MDNLNVSGVYKIVNEVTGDSYIGSSNDVNRRWGEHRRLSVWKKCPNNKMYQDMEKYGVDKFRFQILCPVMPEYLTQVEQGLIEMLKPTYNNYSAKGLNIERHKDYNKKYFKTEKGKEAVKKYQSQLCNYNGETLTLRALYQRFRRAGVKNPAQEAKKYLL